MGLTKEEKAARAAAAEAEAMNADGAEAMEAPATPEPKAAKKAKAWDVNEVLAKGEKFIDPDEEKKGFDQDLIKYKIPMTKGNRDTSVFVSVNGRTFSIPKGQEVTIPRYIAQAYEDSQMQDEAAMEYIAENRKND